MFKNSGFSAWDVSSGDVGLFKQKVIKYVMENVVAAILSLESGFFDGLAESFVAWGSEVVTHWCSRGVIRFRGSPVRAVV